MKIKIVNYEDENKFKDEILKRSLELFSEKKGYKGKYGIGNYPEKGNFFFVQYHEERPLRWSIDANFKKEMREPIQKISFVDEREVEIEVKDVFRCDNYFALFGEIKINGEKIHLLVEYNNFGEFKVKDIYTSCRFEDIFEQRVDKGSNGEKCYIPVTEEARVYLKICGYNFLTSANLNNRLVRYLCIVDNTVVGASGNNIRKEDKIFPDAETFIKYIRTGDDSGLFKLNVKISKDEDNKTHPYSLEISKDFTNWYPLPSVSLAQLRNIRDYINKYIEMEERR